MNVIIPNSYVVSVPNTRFFSILHLLAVQLNRKTDNIKSQLVMIIAEQVDLEKKKVSAVLDTITDIIAKELKKPGLFQIPGLVKIEKKTIPAQKAIKDWKNPFTGEIGTKPAKPASTKVKVRALKKLKDMA